MMSNETYLPIELAYPLILGSCLIGFLFGIQNWNKVEEVDTQKKPESETHILTVEKNGETPLQRMNKTSELIQAVNFSK